MAKVRVYEVAREIGLQNSELIKRIAALGIHVSNHMSVLDQAEVDRVKRAVQRDRAEQMVEERIRPTVVRRRSKVKKPEPVVAAPPEPAPPEPTPVRAAPEPAPVAPVVAEAKVETPAPAPVEPVVAAPPVVVEPAPAPAPSSAPPAVEKTPKPVVEAAPVAPPVAPEPVVAAPPEAEPTPEPTPEPPTPVAPPERTVTRPRRSHASATKIDPEPMAARPGPEKGRPSVSDDEKPRLSTDPPNKKQPAAEGDRAYLPLGVRARGGVRIDGVGGGLSEERRRKIVAEHAASQSRPRRTIRSAGSILPGRRPTGRPGKKRAAPGKKQLKTNITVPSAAKRKIRIEDQIQLQMLAQRMSLKATDVLMKLVQMGMSGVHINSTLDADTASLLADEFGYEVENVAVTEEELVEDARGDFVDNEEDRKIRPPIVTVMGHVDHGKTSLLDKIRKTKVASGEAGGITQHIGAYRVETGKGTVVFLDTPGHEAFTAMRARGAQATDVVILVVAADDGVMPQTREAVSHSQAAGVPIVVAVNKIDRPDAKSDRVMNELASLGLQPEEWGGEVAYVPTSAITGEGVDKLLDTVLLQAEMLELRANEKVPAEGVVLEAYKDRGRGPVANALIRNGTLQTGDYVVAGSAWGRVRALTDDRGKKLRAAGPATPVEILGMQEVPSAGDRLYKVTNQKKAQEVAATATQKGGNNVPATMTAARGLDQLHALMASGDVQELKLVVKGDVQGSVEALIKSLADLSTEKVKVNVILSGVGGITENDVMLANASNAIVIGFNVRPQGKASSAAKKNNVEIRGYSVIYEALDEVKLAMAGLLAPKIVEKDLGKAEVRMTFTIPKIGTIAGCMVVDGKILRNGKARLVRDGVIVWTGDVNSLKRFKEDAKEVGNGFECGIGLQGFNDIKEGDVIESFETEEVQATLE